MICCLQVEANTSRAGEARHIINREQLNLFTQRQDDDVASKRGFGDKRDIPHYSQQPRASHYDTDIKRGFGDKRSQKYYDFINPTYPRFEVLYETGIYKPKRGFGDKRGSYATAPNPTVVQPSPQYVTEYRESIKDKYIQYLRLFLEKSLDIVRGSNQRKHPDDATSNEIEYRPYRR